MFKRFFTWTLIPIILVGGLSYFAYQKFQERTIEKQGEVFLERIRAVSKLTTVEGHFSEVFSYKDFWKYDISPLRKKAMVRVKANVLAGIDLEGLNIETNSNSKLITIGPIPAAEIISIDHELDYYDLTVGTFNSFSATDHTAIQQECKSLIRKAALESNLTIRANQQLDEYLLAFQTLIESNGWQLQIIPNVKDIRPVEAN